MAAFGGLFILFHRQWVSTRIATDCYQAVGRVSIKRALAIMVRLNGFVWLMLRRVRRWLKVLVPVLNNAGYSLITRAISEINIANIKLIPIV